MKKKLLALALVLALGLTACGDKKDSDRPPQGKTDGFQSLLEQKRGEDETAQESPELASLRESITGSGADIGVAYLGYAGDVDSMEEAAALLKGDAYAESYPFLLELPDDAFVDAGGEELYAFVPASSGDALTVTAAEATERGDYKLTGAPLKTGAAGEVLLVRCNVSDLCSNVCVEAAGERFYPALSLMDGSVYMEGEYFDFTLYEALWDFDGSGGENGEWLLSDDETSLRVAQEILCETDEVRYYLDLGMSVQYTGGHEVVDGRECWVFALGTEQDDQFVRERYYAVSDNLIYAYDALSDTWTALGAG